MGYGYVELPHPSMDADMEVQKSKIADFVALPRPDGIVSVVFPSFGKSSKVRVTVHTKTTKGQTERHVVMSEYPSSG